MGAYGSPELLPHSGNEYSKFTRPPQKPPVKRHTGLKFAYAVLLIFAAFFAIGTVSCFYCGDAFIGICTLIVMLGCSIAAHMVHSNTDAVNVANGIATGRICRKAMNGYRSNGTYVNNLNPESAIAYFRYHPIKMHSAGRIVATAVVPFAVCILLFSVTPYMGTHIQPVEQKISSSPVSKAKINATVPQSKGTPSKQTDTETAYKASCKQYTYEQIARNPNSYKGKRIKLTAEVNQIEDAGNGTEMLLLETDSNSSNAVSGSLYALYRPKSYNEERILENDKVTVYGVLNGLQTYTTVMGDSRSVPKLTIEYRDIQSSK